jgi:hypothetical protein
LAAWATFTGSKANSGRSVSDCRIPFSKVADLNCRSHVCRRCPTNACAAKLMFPGFSGVALLDLFAN